MLNYYRSLIALRKSDEYKNVFTYGEFIPVYQDTDSVMAYYRKDEDKQILIAANFGENAVSISLEHPVRQVLLSNTGKSKIASPELKLDSCEVIVVEV